MAGLSGDVKLPGVGNVPKKGVAAGAAVGAVVLIIVYIRNRNSSSSSAATTAAPAAAAAGSDPYPSDGTTGNPSDPFSLDPSTGITYGDEQYAAASGNASYASGAYGGLGSGGSIGDLYPWDGTIGNSQDPYSMDPSTGQTYGDEGASGTGTSTATSSSSSSSSSGGGSGPPFSSNTAWAQYAENYLTQTVGEAPATVANAIGLYLEGQAVNSSEQSLVNQAIGFAGTPPQAGPGGYPPAIKVTSTPNPSSSSAKVPNVVGDYLGSAEDALKGAGFTYQTTPAAPKGSTGWKVTSQKPAGGTSAKKSSLVTLAISHPAPAKKK